MALTVTETTQYIAGDRKIVHATIVFDASYPTGGEAVAASDFPSLQILDELVVASSSPAGTEVVVWDRANQKLAVFTADGTEQANASDATGVDGVQVVATGR